MRFKRRHSAGLKAAAAVPAKAPSSGADWVRIATLLLALASMVCALVGYGVTWAYTAVYGLAPGVWYDNGLELIGLAGDALLGLLFAFTDARSWSSLPTAALWYGGLTAGAIFAGWCLRRLVRSRAVQASRGPIRTSSFARSVISWFGNDRTSWLGHIARGALAAMVGGSVAAMSSVLGIVLVFVALILISLLPYIGYLGGAAYASKTVMGPEACVSAPGKRFRGPRSGVTGAHCVELVDPTSKQRYAGKLVTATASKVILYVPSTDQVVAIPRKGELLMTTEVAFAPAAPASAAARGPAH